jgi:hypothetical protein
VQETYFMREISVEQSNALSSTAYDAGMVFENVVLGIRHEFRAL